MNTLCLLISQAVMLVLAQHNSGVLRGITSRNEWIKVCL